MLGFKFCTCWSLVEEVLHVLVISGGDDARSSKGNKNRQLWLSSQRNRRKGKLDYWAICGDSTNGAVPNVREIGLLILITI